MKKLVIKIAVEITLQDNSTATPESALTAIKRGIYWGLDVKHIAPPLNVNVYEKNKHKLLQP